MAEPSPIDFAMDFVASNESQQRPGTIGDRGRAFGVHQLDVPSGTFPNFYRTLEPAVQQELFPVSHRREAVIDQRQLPTPSEAQRISKFMASPWGQTMENEFYRANFVYPAFASAQQYSGLSKPPKELVALMLDMTTQRGKTGAQNVLKRLGPPGMYPLDASTLIQTELDSLDTERNPGGSAIILDRRVKGAVTLGTRLSPQNIYRTVMKIRNSHLWDQLGPRSREAAARRLRRTLDTAVKATDPKEWPDLKSLRGMLNTTRRQTPVSAVETIAGGD